MEETAYAKLNLALHVRAREPDGYHRIETLFAFCEHGDLLSASPAEGLSLELTGPFGHGLGTEDNLVLRAAEALRSRYGISRGAALVLDKRLPVASGIGGGSADAAAALRLLTRLWGIQPDPRVLEEIAATLGADVPACLRSNPARGEGRGDRLIPVEDTSLSAVPVLLANQGVPLGTAAVFAAWDGVDRGPLASGLPLAAAKAGRNDLEAAARAIVPEIGEVLARLSASPGALLVRMSGSGATCFALFESARDRDVAAAGIHAANPGWWTVATRLR